MPDFYDIALVIGVALVGLGLWLISPPLAYILVGLAVAAVGAWGNMRHAAKGGGD